MELGEFLHDCCVPAIGKLSKASFESVLFFVLGIADELSVSSMQHDIMAYMCHHEFVLDGQVNCYIVSILVGIGGVLKVFRDCCKEVIFSEMGRGIAFSLGVTRS